MQEKIPATDTTPRVEPGLHVVGACAASPPPQAESCTTRARGLLSGLWERGTPARQPTAPGMVCYIGLIWPASEPHKEDPQEVPRLARQEPDDRR